jgi:5,10-methylenetetrahydromethanopterin reductase
MRWAGRLLDGVILHTFVSDEALARCVAEVWAGAEEAGRDPSSVRVWAVLATLHEPDEERLLRGVTGRMATYLQAYGDALVAMNGWDPARLERFRADAVVGSVRGAIDAVGTREQLEHLRDLIPEAWLPAAVGSASRCAARVLDQLAAGADGVILHGSAPAELEPVVAAYREVRPAGYTGRSANPGAPTPSPRRAAQGSRMRSAASSAASGVSASSSCGDTVVPSTSASSSAGCTRRSSSGT